MNGTLNPYAFLITLLHEMAHLQVFEAHKNRVSPHGREWKMAFQALLVYWMEKGVFPESLMPPLSRYAQNPKASTFSDHQLYSALSHWDHPELQKIYLKDLSDQQVFAIGKKQFKKGPLRRTRHLCTEVKSGRQYLIHFMAEVAPLA
ncbi:SprT-like domain-containing protein [bacterium SCSIO 12741]|nr:SprT-like domain-containing protein [bacterium SCSIO 12741]